MKAEFVARAVVGFENIASVEKQFEALAALTDDAVLKNAISSLLQHINIAMLRADLTRNRSVAMLQQEERERKSLIERLETTIAARQHAKVGDRN
jgi:hypothetical protein